MYSSNNIYKFKLLNHIQYFKYIKSRYFGKVKVKPRTKRESFITIDMAIKCGIISFILLALDLSI